MRRSQHRYLGILLMFIVLTFCVFASSLLAYPIAEESWKLLGVARRLGPIPSASLLVVLAVAISVILAVAHRRKGCDFEQVASDGVSLTFGVSALTIVILLVSFLMSLTSGKNKRWLISGMVERLGGVQSLCLFGAAVLSIAIGVGLIMVTSRFVKTSQGR